MPLAHKHLPIIPVLTHIEALYSCQASCQCTYLPSVCHRCIALTYYAYIIKCHFVGMCILKSTSIGIERIITVYGVMCCDEMVCRRSYINLAD